MIGNTGRKISAFWLSAFSLTHIIGVGKTSIVKRLKERISGTSEKDKERVKSTIGVEVEEMRVEVEGRDVELVVWDTAGQERYYSITRSSTWHEHQDYYRRAQLVFIVFDVSDAASYSSKRMGVTPTRGQRLLDSWGKIVMREQLHVRSYRQQVRSRAFCGRCARSRQEVRHHVLRDLLLCILAWRCIVHARWKGIGLLVWPEQIFIISLSLYLASSALLHAPPLSDQHLKHALPLHLLHGVNSQQRKHSCCHLH